MQGGTGTAQKTTFNFQNKRPWKTARKDEANLALRRHRHEDGVFELTKEKCAQMFQCLISLLVV